MEITHPTWRRNRGSPEGDGPDESEGGGVEPPGIG